jgi:hypothetical protein
MEYIELVVAFVSGIIVTLLGAWLNIFLNNREKKAYKLHDAEYEMFLKLGELNNWYFWLASNEVRNRENEQEIFDECYELARDLAKSLHQHEETEFAEELMKVLYDESYTSFNERYKQMCALSKRMADKLSPVHRKYLSSLEESNLNIMASEDFVPKAPALYRFKQRI